MSQDPVRQELELAKQAIEARTKPLSADRQARLWAQIEAAQSQPQGAAWWQSIRAFWSSRSFELSVGLAAAAAIALYVAIPKTPAAPTLTRGALFGGSAALSEGQTVPLKTTLKARAPARVQLAQAELRLEAGVQLELRTPRAVRVLSGGVLVWTDNQPISAQTQEATVEAVSARFRIARTPTFSEVTVHEGTVQLRRANGAMEQLKAPNRTRIPIEQISQTEPSKPAKKTAAVAPPAPVPALEPVSKPLARAPARPSKRTRKLAAPKAPAPGGPRTAPPPIAPKEARRKLAQARRIVRRDAPRARAMAEDVLDRSPPPAERIGALMVLADAHRREGRASKAATTYERVAKSPSAGRFLEEAILRQAELLLGMGQPTEAIAVLRANPIKSGLLAPERTALLADLHAAQGHPDKAAAALEAAPQLRAQAIWRARLKIAEALAPTNIARARTLLAPVVAHAPNIWASRARALLDAWAER